MRKLILGLTIGIVLSPFAVAADPKAIIEKSIDAHGGKKVLEKYPAARSSFTGEITLNGETSAITGTNTTDKGKIKVELEMTIQNMKVKVLQMSDGDKIKVNINVGGMKIDAPVTDAQKDELKMSAAYSDLTTLTPLLDEKRFDLKAEEDVEIEKKKYEVVTVNFKDANRSVKLFFDKETKLLGMFQREGLAPGSTDDKKAKLTTILSEYKKQDGMMIPMKIVSKVEDNVYLTATITEHESLEKVDAKEFKIED